MKKLKSLLLFFVCGLVACAMAIPLAACNDGTGGGGGGDGSSEDNRVLQSITVDSFDAKVNFAVGEEFSYEGLTVTANYLVLGESITTATEDVTSKVDFDTSEFDSSKAGTYTVYLSYTYRKVTMYGDYNVNVLSDLEGTIAGLEVTYDGARQIDLTAENPTATIDLTKIKVTRMSGDTVDDVGETILPEGNYTLSYSKDGGALTAVEAGATSLSGLTKGVYSIYALSTYTLGNETFEMSGFVTVFVVDSLASIAKDEGGTLTYDYGADVNTIGSDWTFTATYGSGATVKLNAEDVDFGERVNDSEGENSVTVSYTEEVLKYDAEADDAVTDSVTVDCDVTYTIGENPNAGQEVTDTYSVNFSLTEWSDAAYASGGSGMPFGTPLPIGTDGKPGTSGGIMSVWGKDANSNCYIREANSSGTAAGYSNEFYLGAIELSSGTVRRALSIDLTDYDSAEITVVWRADKDRGISLFTDEAAATAADSAALRENGYMDSENATDLSQMLTTKFENVEGGDIYYFGGNNNTVYIYEIIVEATKLGGSDTPAMQDIAVDMEDVLAAMDNTTEALTDKELITAEVASSGIFVRGSKDLTLNKSTKSDKDGNTYNVRLKLGGNVESAALELNLQAGATVTVAVRSSSGSSARDIGLFTAMDADTAVGNTQHIDPNVDGDIVFVLTFNVEEAGTYYLGSVSSGLGIYAISVSY